MNPGRKRPGLGARLFAVLQYPLPQHALSRIVHWLTRREAGRITHLAIKAFIRIMRVDMGDARDSRPSAYPSFNAFFTRELAEGARPLAPESHRFVSPVDGSISQLGAIEAGKLLQAKGHDYSVSALLGDETLAAEYAGGAFATIYLAPNNYHRIHMPAAGRLRCMRLVPGRLFSVNAATAACIPGLFARNERVVCVFDGEDGPFAMVLVGAMFVGSIETVWAGEITPGGGRKAQTWNYQESERIWLPRGAEMGRFNMGSTVILLHPGRSDWLQALAPGSDLRLGQALTPVDQPSAAQ